MKSLPLVLCVVALLGAASSAALYLRIGNSKKILETELVAARARASALDRQLAAAGEQNTTLEKRLTALDNDLGETKSRLTSSEARAVQLAREVNQAKALVAAHDQAERLLGEQVVALQKDLADARSALAPETLAAYKTTIADLERQLADARSGATAPAVAGASTAVFTTRPPAAVDARLANSDLPAPPAATASHLVVNVGPSSAFVVLDYGANHGAQNGQLLAIVRGTDSLASVLISDVRPNFSVAQVRPDSLRGALHKGDSAVLTN